MVRVDLDANGSFSFGFRDEVRANRAQCFSQDHACTAMEQPIGLVGPWVYRHLAHNGAMLY